MQLLYEYLNSVNVRNTMYVLSTSSFRAKYVTIKCALLICNNFYVCIWLANLLRQHPFLYTIMNPSTMVRARIVRLLPF